MLISFASFFGACAGIDPAPVNLNTPSFTDDYTIGIGDKLRIDVWRNPDLSITDVPVRPDGKISTPLAGDLAVGGIRPQEAAELIAEALVAYIREPKVTVIITEIGLRYRVRVTGAVNEPVSMPYSQDMTVLDALLEAGGMTDFARPSRTMLHRSDGTSLSVRLDQILYRGDMRTNYRLGPGDTLIIPERPF